VDDLRERLAELEHEQWALWTKYMLDSLEPLLDLNRISFYDTSWREFDVAKFKLAGWQRQIATPYAELTEREKDSDREWADRVLAIVDANGDAGLP